MKTLSAVVIAVIALLLPVLSATAEDPPVRMDLDCPRTIVLGYPALISLTIRPDRAVMHSFPVARLDLASVVDQGVYIELLFDSETGKTGHIGYKGPGRPEVEFVPPPPRNHLKVGEQIVLTFDLSQLLFGSALRAESALPPPGKYRFSALYYSTDWRSAPQEVTIREPTPDEKRFSEALQKQGIGKKWFPAVITDDNLQLPDDIPLPAETAQLREFIKVLRLAVRNPDAALKQIDDEKDSWGHLQDAVTELKYECVAKAKGKDSAAAQDMRRTLDADAKTKGRLTRLEKAGGLLDHFAEIRTAKPKDK